MHPGVRRGVEVVGVLVLVGTNLGAAGMAARMLILHGPGEGGWVMVWLAHSAFARDVAEFWTKWLAEHHPHPPSPRPHHFRETDPEDA